MDLQIKDLGADILNDLKNAYGEKWESIKEMAEESVLKARKRMATLAAAQIKGDIADPQFFLQQLKNEAVILENELLSYQVIAGATVMNVTGTLMDLLAKIVYRLIAPDDMDAL